LRTTGFSVVVFLAIGLRLGFSPPAVASDKPSTDVDDARVAARAHFDKGLAATSAQRFGEAAEEFQRAYDLWPDFKVLYNIGRVRVALGQPVEAVDAYRAYLAQGGDQIATERKDEVRREIDEQRPRIATIAIRTSVDGAEVRIDGRLVGHSPLPTPVRVGAGKHTIEALLPGLPAQLRDVDAPGAETTQVALEFPPKVHLAAAVAWPVVASSPRDPSHGRRVLGYVVAGAGLVAVAAGTALAFSGLYADNDARANAVAATTASPVTMSDLTKYDQARQAHDDARTRNELGWTMVGIGGAAFVAGAALVVVSSRVSSPTGHEVAARIVPQPTGLSLQGTW
jgi:tetratricopeptide (TPR) repeat protein